MWASSTACAAWTTRACPTRSVRRSPTASRPRLRLLDERCRVYQYLLKRTRRPFAAAACRTPIAHEAIQRRAAYLNAPSPRTVRPVAVPGAALRSTARRPAEHRAARVLACAPQGALRAWLSLTDTLQLLESGAGPGDRHAAPQGAGVRSADRATSDRRDWRRPKPSVLPPARELRAGRRRRRPADARHAPGLLRVRTPPVDCHRDHLMVGDRPSRCCR